MSLVTADTSVVVPSLAGWHEHHDLALRAIEEVDRLPAHVLLETLSVLTRLPGGLAQPLTTAVGLVREAFPEQVLTLPATAYDDLVGSLAGAGLGGGSVYDGLIAATAHHHGARLLSLDARALPVYRALGVDVGWVASPH